MFNSASILVTGGTGTFGNAFVRRVLTYDIEKVVVMSRDEAKQEDMMRAINDDRVRFILGDVRDAERVSFAFRSVDHVVHAAALKRIPRGDTDPMEFTRTNVYGTENVVKAAIANNIEKVVTLSTDKAASPCTHYGATKYLAETTTVAANDAYRGKTCATRFAATRYGNVMGSRGSIVPLFRRQVELGQPVTITDSNMSRFWMTVDDAVELVLSAFWEMEGGEIFVPKCPSFWIWDLARVIANGGKIEHVGVRGSEKLHEALIGPSEGRTAVEAQSMYILNVTGKKLPNSASKWSAIGKKLPRDFEYTSDTNEQFLTRNEIRERLDDLAI